MRRQEETRLAKALLDDLRTTGQPRGSDSERLASAWEELELPAPAAAPSGFAERVVARALAERTLLPGFALSPRWAVVMAALLIAAGVAGGAKLGANALAEATSAPADELALFSDDALLDDYFSGATASESAGTEVEP